MYQFGRQGGCGGVGGANAVSESVRPSKPDNIQDERCGQPEHLECAHDLGPKFQNREFYRSRLLSSSVPLQFAILLYTLFYKLFYPRRGVTVVTCGRRSKKFRLRRPERIVHAATLLAMLFLAPQLLSFAPSAGVVVPASRLALHRSPAPLATFANGGEPAVADDQLMSVVNVEAGGEAAAAAAALREILGEAEEPLFEVVVSEDLLGGDEKLTVPQLKELLKAKGLPVGGKKAELVSRLASAATSSTDVVADAVADANTDALNKGEEAADPTVIANSAVDPRMVELLSAKGIVKFTPIQIQSFDLLRSGADMLGRSQTGTAAWSKRPPWAVHRDRGLHLLRARLAALGGSALPEGRGWAAHSSRA